MTRLPSDTFLPSGAMTDSSGMYPSFAGLNGVLGGDMGSGSVGMGDSSGSVVSPFNLPRSGGAPVSSHTTTTTTSSYFDDPILAAATTAAAAAAAGISPHTAHALYSHQQPGHQQFFLSPHLQPLSATQRHQQRSASLSPTRRAMPTRTSRVSSSAVTSPLRGPIRGLPSRSTQNMMAVGGGFGHNPSAPPTLGGGNGAPNLGPPMSAPMTLRSVSADGTHHQQYRQQQQPYVPPTTTSTSAFTLSGLPTTSSSSSAAAAVATVASSSQQQQQHAQIRLLMEQNRALMAAWERERKTMQASRDSVHEVYMRERAIFDGEREAWSSERAALVAQIGLLEEKVRLLEAGIPPAAIEERLKTLSRIMLATAPRAANAAATVAAATGSIETGIPAVDGPAESTSSGMRLESIRENDFQLPPSVLYSGNGAGLSSRTPYPTPYGPPAKSQFLPLNGGPSSMVVPGPSTSSAAPKDFMAGAVASAGGGEPSKPVDVGEIYGGLEGIRVKGSAVKKSTFTDAIAGEKPTPQKAATTNGNGKEASPMGPPPPPANNGGSGGPDAASNNRREQTLRLFSAQAHERLTMHAGHTPNHSLTNFPTVSQSEASTRAGSVAEPAEQSTTRIVGASLGIVDAEAVVDDDVEHDGDRGGSGNETETEASSGAKGKRAAVADEPSTGSVAGNGPEEPSAVSGGGGDIAAQGAGPVEGDDEHGQGNADNQLQDDDDDNGDIPLRGPLHLRNIEGFDERFLQSVNERLLEDTTPKILMRESRESSPSGAAGGSEKKAAGGGSGGKDDDDDASEDNVEIPLRLKKSNNFGAPFGELK